MRAPEFASPSSKRIGSGARRCHSTLGGQDGQGVPHELLYVVPEYVAVVERETVRFDGVEELHGDHAGSDGKPTTGPEHVVRAGDGNRNDRGPRTDCE